MSETQSFLHKSIQTAYTRARQRTRDADHDVRLFTELLDRTRAIGEEASADVEDAIRVAKAAGMTLSEEPLKSCTNDFAALTGERVSFP